MERVFTACFQFIEKMVRDNPPIQEKVSDYAAELLKKPVGIPAMAGCLAEVWLRARASY